MDRMQQVVPCDVKCSDPQLMVIACVTPTYTQGQTKEDKGTKLVRKVLQNSWQHLLHALLHPIQCG